MRRDDLAAALLLAVFAALCVDSARRNSVTADEVAHLPAGYSYVRTGDMRMNPQHPPLAKALAGLPLLALDLAPVGDSPSWHAGREWDFGRELLIHNRVSVERIALVGRLGIVLLGLLLGAVLHGWARDLWGPGPALGVLALFAFCPNMIAHSGVVTTDLGLATFSVAAVYSAWRASREERLSWWLLSGVGLGLALLVKYSALVTAALLVALAALDCGLRAEPWRLRARRFVKVVLALALPAVGLASLAFPDGLAGYARGYALIHADNNPRFQPFLWGEHAWGGFWYYCLLAQWWKTPIPALVLAAAALVLAARARGRRERLDWAFVLLPIAAFHLVAVIKHPSIGLRHVLPVFPFLHLACGGVLARARSPGRRVALGVLGAWYVAGTLAVHPLHLSYFNALAGGPNGGVRYLGDSDVDWGQDYLRLRALLERRFPEPVRLSALAPLPPLAYRIAAQPMTLRDLVLPEPGFTYVLGAAQLQAATLYFDYPGIRLDWLERYRHVARAGASLFLFRFTDDPARAGDPEWILLPQDRREQALRRLREIAQRHPRFEAAADLLAEMGARPGPLPAR